MHAAVRSRDVQRMVSRRIMFTIETAPPDVFLCPLANSLLSVIDRVGGCPVCMHPFDRSHIINLSQSAPASQPEPTAALASATPNKKRRKGKAEAPATPAQDGDKAGTGVFHSSAKLDAVLRTLHQVLKVRSVREMKDWRRSVFGC